MKYEVNDKLIGRRVKCSKCGAFFRVPTDTPNVVGAAIDSQTLTDATEVQKRQASSQVEAVAAPTPQSISIALTPPSKSINPKTYEELVVDVGNWRDLDLRQSAVESLGSLGDPRGILNIVCLARPETGVESPLSITAEKAFWKLVKPAAVQSLLKVFGDYPRCSDLAEAALLQIGESATTELIAAAKDSSRNACQVGAIRVLSRLGTANAIDGLISCLNQPRYLRCVDEISEAFVRIGPVCIPALRKCLNSSIGYSATNAARALARFQWKPSYPMERVRYAIAVEGFEEAAAEGVKAVVPLATWIAQAGPDVTHNVRAVTALLAIGDRGAAALRELLADTHRKHPEYLLRVLVGLPPTQVPFELHSHAKEALN